MIVPACLSRIVINQQHFFSDYYHVFVDFVDSVLSESVEVYFVSGNMLFRSLLAAKADA